MIGCYPSQIFDAPPPDNLVARTTPAVYSFAARLADDPREAIALTRQAFNGARKTIAKRMQSNGNRGCPDRCGSTHGTCVRLTWNPDH